MNITLSADPQLVEKGREVARKSGTSLNQLIREYLERLVESESGRSVAAEFRRVATEEAGCSPAGYRFNREEAHQRR